MQFYSYVSAQTIKYVKDYNTGTGVVWQKKKREANDK
jgi:hypothetical protein